MGTEAKIGAGYLPLRAYANKAAWSVYDGRGSRVATISNGIIPQEAFAKLFASAPELLAALERAEQQIYYGQTDEAHRIIRAALKLAKGD